MVHIYPAVMGLNQVELQKIESLKKISDRVHIDIMDTIFVPAMTEGAEHIKEESKKIGFFPWVHLMVQHPLPFYQQLALPGQALVSFHIESSVDVFAMIKSIKEKKHAASIAIAPKTEIKEAIPFLSTVDQVVVMSVNPGFSGQPFLAATIKKVKELIAMREAKGYSFRIALDGGINRNNIGLLAVLGVDDFAVSSGIFGQKSPFDALCELQDIVDEE